MKTPPMLVNFSTYCEHRRKDEAQMLKDLNLVNTTFPIMVMWYIDDLLHLLTNPSAPLIATEMQSDVEWLRDNDMVFEVVNDHCAIFLFNEEHIALFKLARL